MPEEAIKFSGGEVLQAQSAARFAIFESKCLLIITVNSRNDTLSLLKIYMCKLKDCFIINAMNLNSDTGTNILSGSKKFVPLKMYILLAFQRGTAQ